MKTHAGMLDQRITLERITTTRDGAGGATEQWSTYATVWAKVTPKTGRERDNAMRNEAVAEYTIEIRYRSDIRTSDRIGWRGRKFNISFPKNAGPREIFLEIDAVLGTKS